MCESTTKRLAYLAMTVAAAGLLIYAAMNGHESETDRLWSVGIFGFLIRDIGVRVDALVSRLLADAKADLAYAKAVHGALLEPSDGEN